MGIINPTDQQQIAQSIESASRELISELPSLAKGQAIISGVAINTPALVRIRKRLTSDARGRSKDAPVLWAAQRKYEEKYQGTQVRADEEMDVGVWGCEGWGDGRRGLCGIFSKAVDAGLVTLSLGFGYLKIFFEYFSKVRV